MDGHRERDILGKPAPLTLVGATKDCFVWIRAGLSIFVGEAASALMGEFYAIKTLIQLALNAGQFVLGVTGEKPWLTLINAPIIHGIEHETLVTSSTEPSIRVALSAAISAG